MGDGDDKGGVAWGMSLDEEDQIRAYQENLEKGGGTDGEYGSSGEEDDGDENDDIKLVNIENLSKRPDLSDKQK